MAFGKHQEAAFKKKLRELNIDLVQKSSKREKLY